MLAVMLNSFFEIYTDPVHLIQYGGIIILLVILLLVSFGTAIWLGMLKEFLILIGAFLLFFILLAGAFKREHGHLSSDKTVKPELQESGK